MSRDPYGLKPAYTSNQNNRGNSSNRRQGYSSVATALFGHSPVSEESTSIVLDGDHVICHRDGGTTVLPSGTKFDPAFLEEGSCLLNIQSREIVFSVPMSSDGANVATPQKQHCGGSAAASAKPRYKAAKQKQRQHTTPRRGSVEYSGGSAEGNSPWQLVTPSRPLGYCGGSAAASVKPRHKAAKQKQRQHTTPHRASVKHPGGSAAPSVKPYHKAAKKVRRSKPVSETRTYQVVTKNHQTLNLDPVEGKILVIPEDARYILCPDGKMVAITPRKVTGEAECELSTYQVIMENRLHYHPHDIAGVIMVPRDAQCILCPDGSVMTFAR